MDDNTVLVFDRDGKEWQVDPDPSMDAATFARSLLEDGACATATIAEGHFVMIPAHAIVRVEVTTAEALIAKFDSRSASRRSGGSEGA